MVKKEKDGLTSATIRKKIKIQLINQDFILISVAAEFRTPDFLSMLRELGGVYNQDFRGHVYMKENYDQLVDGVKKMLQSKGQQTGIIDGIPKCAIDYVRPMPSEFIFKLNTVWYKITFNEHTEVARKEGIQFGLRRFGRLLIADEMGVGKTIQALGLCALYRSEWPVLIVCPSSLKYNWKSEALEWLPMFLHSEEIQILNKSSDPILPGSKFIIMSYDLAKKQSEDLAKMRFKIAICDEAHYLKNPMSKRSEEITPILKTSKRVLMLTGTPALAKPRELFPVLSCIRPDVYTEFKEFGKRYCCPMVNRFTKKMEYDGADNMEELNFILKTVMIRRLKKDVLSELPWKTRQIVQIKTSAKEIKQIEKLISELESQGSKIDQIISQMGGDHNGTGARPGGAMPGLAGRDENDRNKVLTIATRCFELSAHAKLEGVIEFLTDLEAYDEKLVVFAHHQYMLDGLEAFTQSRKKGYIRIDGRVDSMSRGKLVERFQTDPTVKYALLAITAASVGITLTASNTVIFAELHWTPANVIQAEDRCHRITQKKNVICYYLHGEKTLDTQMFSIIKKKFETTSKILDGENAQLLNIDREIQAADIVNQRDLDELDDLEVDLDLKPSKQALPSTAVITDIDDELADLDLQLIETKPALTGPLNTQGLSQASSPGAKNKVSVIGFRKTGGKPKPNKQSLDVQSDSDGETKAKSRIGRAQKQKKSVLVAGDEAIMIDEGPNAKIEAELDDIEEIVEKQGGSFFVKDKHNIPVSARTGLTAQQKEVKKKAKAQQKKAAASKKQAPSGRGKHVESSGEDSDDQGEIFENALEDIDDDGDGQAIGSDDNLDEGEDDEDLETNLFGKQPRKKPGDPDDDIEIELDDLEISALLAVKNAKVTQAVEEVPKFGSSSSPNQATNLKNLLGGPKPSNPLLGNSSPVSQQQQSSSSLFNTARAQPAAGGPRAALLLNPSGRGVVNANKTTIGSILSNGRLASAAAHSNQPSPLAGKAVSSLSTQEKLQVLREKMQGQQKPAGKKGSQQGPAGSKGKSVGKAATGAAKVISLDDEPVQLAAPRRFSAGAKGGKGPSASKDKKNSLLVGKKPKEVPKAFTELHTKEPVDTAPVAKFFAQGGPHSAEEGRYVKGPVQPVRKNKGYFKPKGRVKPNQH